MRILLTLLFLVQLVHAYSQFSSSRMFPNDFHLMKFVDNDLVGKEPSKRRRKPKKNTYFIPSLGLRSIDLGGNFHVAWSAALAFRMTKDLKFQEIKIAGHVNEYMKTFLFGNQILRGTEFEYLGFDVGYSYGYTLFNNSTFQLNGAGIFRIGYRDINENPATSRSYPIDLNRYVMGLGMQIEFIVHLSKFVDVGLSGDIPLLDLYREQRTENNPFLLDRDRISMINASSIFSRELALRLSILFQMV